MTVLDNFIAFARALPAGRRQEVEDSLAVLMDSFNARFDFSGEEMDDLLRRANETDPAYSDPADLTKIFGKPFRT